MDLFKQAIADAKAVKQIAMKNAISTLTEAFAPQMQSLLSKRIAEEDMEDEELDIPLAEDEMEDEETSEMPPAPAPPAAPVAPEPPMPEDEDELDLDEVLAELEGEEEEMPLEETEDEFAAEEEPEMDDESIDEILREVEDELAAEDETEEAPVEMPVENRNLRRKLKEAYKVISAQKSVLNEVGVLNAKLLYTTKILGKHDLTENQKMKILEAFDRAKSLRETKLVYATIIESLNKKPAKSSHKAGTSSKSIKALTKPTIKESVDHSGGNVIDTARWKILAGM